MLNKVKQECKLLGMALCVGVLFALGVAAYTYVYSETVQRDIAENVIRFHVLAHSDDDIDQELKETVRLDVLAEFAAGLSTGTSIEVTRQQLAAYLPAIRDYAEEAVRRAGFSHPVSAQMSTVFFPTRRYGGMAFPPGNYEAVQIIIGDGAGSNWWCLMFPPLCYMDMTATYAGRQLLADTLTEEGFRLLTYAEADSAEIAVRFRIVEWWQNRNQPTEQDTPETQLLKASVK